ncbi:MAG: zinc carboxypeptidase [Saprospiraceae bacterium]|nr:zinc carboxypeptidase [Saprospiraceae bacterium]
MLKRLPVVLLLTLNTLLAHAQFSILPPDAFLPHKVGTQFTDHASLVDYYRHVDNNSDRVKVIEFGRTWEQRPQILAIVSSPENLLRIEDIRLDNLRNAGILPNKGDQGNPIAIVWLGFSVHGNEAAGSEASMPVLYQLAFDGRPETAEWLKNTVVLIEPSVNPDGYSRYTDWYRQASPALPDPAPHAREHDEPWPRGRVNHYNFDLNRDWAWATQIETQNRLRVYNDWLPHVVADIHEQGYNDPYYFAPAAQPYHKYLTKWQTDFQVEIGKNHAKYFDRNGWLYFTKEVFDLFYPSYGDTYPCYNGAIGMTYEQGGIGAGRAVHLHNGDTLTLADRVAHHTATALSTVEISSKNAARLVQNFNDFYQKSRNNPPGEYKSFIIKRTNPISKIKAFAQQLDRLGIQYGKAGMAVTGLSGYDYTTGQEAKFALSENDLVVSAYQPKGLFAQVLLEPESAMVDSNTYDITAWCLLHAHGLEAYATKQRVDPSQQGYSLIEGTVGYPESTPYAYLAAWNAMDAARLLANWTKQGVVCRYAESAFRLEGRDWPAGTLVATRADNRKNPKFDRVVQTTATRLGLLVATAQTGFVDAGRDLGSDGFRLVKAPKVLVLSGEKTWNNEYGQVWFYFDKDIEYPATFMDADRLGRADLADYNVIVMPEGNYDFSESTLEKLGNWVSGGGKLIAIGEANASLAEKKGFALAKYVKSSDKDAALSEEDRHALDHRTALYKDRSRTSISDFNPGAVVRAKLDNSHPLAFGMKPYYFSLKTSGLRYDLLKDAWNVGYLEDNYKSHGFIGANVKKLLRNSALFAVQDKGRGQVVYLIDNPLFRSFWEEGKLVMSNALFLVN